MARRLSKIDKDALRYMFSKHLAVHFQQRTTSESVFSSTKKVELQERAQQLQIPSNGSTSQLLRGIAERLISQGTLTVPLQYVSAAHLQRTGGREDSVLSCWLCGSRLDANVDSMADFQCGSWPPGDERRWSDDGQFVLPALFCQTACKVGSFATLAGVFMGDGWLSLEEILRLGQRGLSDGLLSVPLGPCIERVALQCLNWYSLSGAETADCNYLPARVYLTRPCKLVIRGGRAVGFVTFCEPPDTAFPLRSLNAMFVLPEARNAGAAREMLIDFFSPQPPGSAECGEGRDLPLAGIETPVSAALLAALPRVLSERALRRIVVVEHGDDCERATRRPTLWSAIVANRAAVTQVKAQRKTAKKMAEEQDRWSAWAAKERLRCTRDLP
jgi:hypothetical protein